MCGDGVGDGDCVFDVVGVGFDLCEKVFGVGVGWGFYEVVV